MSQATSLNDLFGPTVSKPDGKVISEALQAAARERILILDGAMGTQIQGLDSTRTSFAVTGSAVARANRRATTIC